MYKSATVRVLAATVAVSTGLFGQTAGPLAPDRQHADRPLPGRLGLGSCRPGVVLRRRFPVAASDASRQKSSRPRTSKPGSRPPGYRRRIRRPRRPDAFLNRRPRSEPAESARPAFMRSPDSFIPRRIAAQAGIISRHIEYSSIIGGGVRDLAVSPANDQEATVAAHSGVFRTVDGGKSWSSLNQGLPNLPAAQLLSLPFGRSRRPPRASRWKRHRMGTRTETGVAAR